MSDKKTDAEIEVSRVKSINMRTLGYSAKEIRKLVDGKPEMIFLARVGGVAVQAFSGESKHGAWHGLKGIFSMIGVDGKAYQSQAAFLPNNIIKGVLENLNGGVAEVSFMFDIYAQESEKNASGYAFICEPTVSSGAEAKALSITNTIVNSKLPKNAVKALPAPAKK